MSGKPSRSLIPSGGGFFQELSQRIKLIARLMADRRVHPLLKLLPLASVVYLFIPDLAPGPIDDAAVIWLGAYLFVELCPPEVVEEHLQALDAVIEGEFRQVDPQPDDAPSQLDEP